MTDSNDDDLADIMAEEDARYAARRPVPITEKHRMWPLYRAGKCCEFATMGCTEGGRRCRDHGGCCNHPLAPHWSDAEQSRLTPAAAVEMDGVSLSVKARERALVSGRWCYLMEPAWDGRVWRLEFDECGCAFYDCLNVDGQGGGHGSLVSLVLLAEQGMLL